MKALPKAIILTVLAAGIVVGGMKISEKFGGSKTTPETYERVADRKTPDASREKAPEKQVSAKANSLERIVETGIVKVGGAISFEPLLRR